MNRKQCGFWLALGSLLWLSACATPTDSDPVTAALAGPQPPLWLVPINHTDRYAPTITVDGVWAGNVNARGGGGKATCCVSGSRDWRKPVLVEWRWGREEDPVTKAITLPGENRSAWLHFPRPPHRVQPRADTGLPEVGSGDERRLCIIFRSTDKVELDFSPTGIGCWQK